MCNDCSEDLCSEVATTTTKTIDNHSEVVDAITTKITITTNLEVTTMTSSEAKTITKMEITTVTILEVTTIRYIQLKVRYVLTLYHGLKPQEKN